MKVLAISSIGLLFGLMFMQPALAGDPFAGSGIYAQYCVSCHGGDGSGEVAGTPSFRGGRILTKSQMDLLSTVKSGKDLMPAFQGILTEDQIDDVVAYIRTFN